MNLDFCNPRNIISRSQSFFKLLEPQLTVHLLPGRDLGRHSTQMMGKKKGSVLILRKKKVMWLEGRAVLARSGGNKLL